MPSRSCRVTSGDKLRAVLFGYACHATTLGFYNWCADYPGFAMMDLEAAHPGTVALFWAGWRSGPEPAPPADRRPGEGVRQEARHGRRRCPGGHAGRGRLGPDHGPL